MPLAEVLSVQWNFLAWGCTTLAVLAAVLTIAECIRGRSRGVLMLIGISVSLFRAAGASYSVHKITSTEVIRHYGILEELSPCARTYINNTHFNDGALVRRLHRTDVKKAIKYCELRINRARHRLS